MTEDELLQGITQALTLAGWRWTHIINSRGVTMGDPGLPDIIAVHPNRPGRVLCWELKGQNSRGDNGRPTYDQVAWIAGLDASAGVDARFIYPADYDQALRDIIYPPVVDISRPKPEPSRSVTEAELMRGHGLEP
jgi:hypothetical protein